MAPVKDAKNLNRRDFLGLTAAAVAGLSLSPLAVHAQSAPSRNLIIVFAGGGWDATYSLDPKPNVQTVDAPVGAVKMYGDLPIFVDTSRPNVELFFDNWSSMSCVINGINVRSIAHPSCQKRILTGTPSESSPDLAAIAAATLGTDLPVPYLILGDRAFTGPYAGSAGRVGSTNQVKALLTPADAYAAPAGSQYAQPTFVPDTSDEATIRAFIEARAAREAAVRGSKGYNKARIDDFVASLERGDLLKPYSDDLGTRGITLQLAAQLTLAADVIEQGVSHSVMVDTRLNWDTHQNNDQQNAFHDSLFAALDGMAGDLASRPGKTAGNTLLDETVVVVMSEMTRTPLLNATNGKDHWPFASAMVMGAGVAGDKVCGGTTDLVDGEPTDLDTGAIDPNGTYLQTEHLVAGLLELVGVDPTAHFPTTTPLRGFIG